MLNRENIKRLASLHKTSDINIAREYVQHLFLSLFYREKDSRRVLFKGGTALRIVFQSPRFSEDLDFSGFDVGLKTLESLLVNVMDGISRTGIAIDLSESKKTSGGYIGMLDLEFSGFRPRILLEVSLRKKNMTKGEPVMVAGDFLPPYMLEIFPREKIVDEKLAAALTRAKPRDYFDTYFLLRKGLVSVTQRKALSGIKRALEKSKTSFEEELGAFLPGDQKKIIRDFKEILMKEISRYA